MKTFTAAGELPLAARRGLRERRQPGARPLRGPPRRRRGHLGRAVPESAPATPEELSRRFTHLLDSSTGDVSPDRIRSSPQRSRRRDRAGASISRFVAGNGRRVGDHQQDALVVAAQEELRRRLPELRKLRVSVGERRRYRRDVVPSVLHGLPEPIHRGLAGLVAPPRR